MGQRGLSQLQITLLGTSAAQPTIDRNLSGLACKADRDLLLFDCGEGTQRQMLRFGTGFDVSAVFFTHFHADHYLGIIGFLRTLSMMGRRDPLTLYGPSPARTLLHKAIHLGVESLQMPIEIHELGDGDVVTRTGYRVRAVAGQHTMRALGYVVDEDARPGPFSVERAQALGIPSGPLYGRLQNGTPVQLPDGRVVKPDDVLGPWRRGRRFAVSGDTRPTSAFAQAARGADLMVHEATFSDDEQDRAHLTQHSTAREAGGVAHEAGAHRLLLTHLSSRHDRTPERLLAEARSVYAGGVDVGHDGHCVDLPPSDELAEAPARVNTGE